MNKYTIPDTAEAYIKWLDSEDGHIQQETLLNPILQALSGTSNQTILDAACGSGWLSGALAKTHPNIQGCDESAFLIKKAQSQFPSLNFKQSSLLHPLPYTAQYFDTIILNMAIQDLEDITAGLYNLSHVLKPGGRLIITLPNPAYAYPAGMWKRGIIGRLLGRKPQLKIRPWNTLSAQHDMQDQLFSWSNHWRPLSAYFTSLNQSGFVVTNLRELKSDRDSDHFNLQYQLYRFPLFLLLECKKLGD
jgi:SAM-dependent methyltransferase